MRISAVSQLIDDCDFVEGVCTCCSFELRDKTVEPPKFKCAAGRSHRVGYAFWCPGCDLYHMIRVAQDLESDIVRPCWSFNEDIGRPTFEPFYKMDLDPTNGRHLCNFQLTDGVVIYHDECTHPFRGRRVPLVMIVEPNAKLL